MGPEGFNTKYVKQLADFINREKNTDFIIVCGGGHFCRQLIKSARDGGVTSNIELDRIAIEVTRLNAYIVKEVLKANGNDVVPYVPLSTDSLRGFIGKYRVIVAGGFVEGVTTDTDAVLAAEASMSKLIINVGKIGYVYDKDPAKHSDAKKQKTLTYEELIKISGENDQRMPGSNVIFDLFAAKLAARSKIEIKFVGADIKAIEAAAHGKPHDGTTVKAR